MRCFRQIATDIIVLGLILIKCALPCEARQAISKRTFQEEVPETYL